MISKSLSPLAAPLIQSASTASAAPTAAASVVASSKTLPGVGGLASRLSEDSESDHEKLPSSFNPSVDLIEKKPNTASSSAKPQHTTSESSESEESSSDDSSSDEDTSTKKQKSKKASSSGPGGPKQAPTEPQTETVDMDPFSLNTLINKVN